MTDNFFRAGVGAVVLDNQCRIMVLRRKGAGDARWQLPQGGLEGEEEPESAVLRELREETGLGRADVRILRVTVDWLAYELPAENRNAKVGRGQVQKWFLCRLLALPDAVRPDGLEFDQVDWVDRETLVQRAVPFRAGLYRRILAEFAL